MPLAPSVIKRKTNVNQIVLKQRALGVNNMPMQITTSKNHSLTSVKSMFKAGMIFVARSKSSDTLMMLNGETGIIISFTYDIDSLERMLTKVSMSTNQYIPTLFEELDIIHMDAKNDWEVAYYEYK
jgi:hypothetical protein